MRPETIDKRTLAKGEITLKVKTNITKQIDATKVNKSDKIEVLVLIAPENSRPLIKKLKNIAPSSGRRANIHI